MKNSRSASRTCPCRAMPSRRASMPRIRRAISCRRPARLLALRFPDGVRVDTGVDAGQRDHAVLRSDDRQDDRPRADPRDCARQAGVGARPHHRGRPPHQSGAAVGPLPRRWVPRGKVRHRLHRTEPWRRSGVEGADRAAAAFGVAEMLARDIARIGHSLDRAPEAPSSPWDATDGFQLSGARALTLPHSGRRRAVQPRP